MPNSPDTPGVLCSGNIVYDTLVTPVTELTWSGTTFVDSIQFHMGGNGASTSRVLAKLGVPVRLLGAISSDAQGQLMLDHLHGSGVDVTRLDTVPEPSSASVVIVNPDGERKFFHRIGSSAAALPQGIAFTPALCEGMAHYHMASLFVMPLLRPGAADTLCAAHTAGLTTSFDTNWDPQGTWMRDLEPCLRHLDFLFMNEPEACMITGCNDPAAAAKVVLSRNLGAAVLKLGGDGCRIYSGEREFRCPSYQVDVRDTTGAGDCFVAGFLAAILAGASLQEAGQFANAVAALSVEHVGAVRGVRSRAETEAWMLTARMREPQPVR